MRTSKTQGRHGFPICVSVTMCGSVDICSFPITVVMANNSSHVDSDQASNEVW